MLKAIARRLPAPARDALRHAYHSFQIARGTFRSPEPEWDRLAEWLGPGDTVLNIGANIGHYALRMSELVGPAGRIIAVEPAPENFAALTANSRRFRFANVTLLNLAIGDKARACGLSIPTWPDGTPNGYLARIDPQGQVSCLAIRLDALELPGPVRLAKIDAEGYEARVLDGMRRILEPTGLLCSLNATRRPKLCWSPSDTPLTFRSCARRTSSPCPWPGRRAVPRLTGEQPSGQSMSRPRRVYSEAGLDAAADRLRGRWSTELQCPSPREPVAERSRRSQVLWFGALLIFIHSFLSSEQRLDCWRQLGPRLEFHKRHFAYFRHNPAAAGCGERPCQCVPRLS